MRLEARDISFKYGKGTRQILDHVNLTVEPGESVGIMAPSGYGKTTLCKILAGYERPDSGEVLVDGMPVLELRGYCPVQMVWQHPELSVNPKRRLSTVLEEGDWTFENPASGHGSRRDLGSGTSGKTGSQWRSPAASFRDSVLRERWGDGRNF